MLHSLDHPVSDIALSPALLVTSGILQRAGVRVCFDAG
jgi:hypothetical protein